MKYKKNKLRLNETQRSSILLRKNMLNSILAFFFWKASTFSSFERFLCWKSRNYSKPFSLEISSDIHLSPIINYWGSIFMLYLTWRAFSVVCVLSTSFFSFFLLFFLPVFSLTDTNDSRDHREGRGGFFISLIFRFHPLKNIH